MINNLTQEFNIDIINPFKRCLTCNIIIEDSDPYIIAYKNKIPVYFCKKHINDAKKYLDNFQEFIEIKNMEKN